MRVWLPGRVRVAREWMSRREVAAGVRRYGLLAASGAGGAAGGVVAGGVFEFFGAFDGAFLV